MKPRTIAVLAVVTLVVTLAAATAALFSPGAGRLDVSGELAFPEIRERSADIATIRIQRGDDTLTIESAGEGWALAERSGYPVEAEKVRSTIATLAQMRFIEAKTTRPDLYGRLEVEDPGDEDATSRSLVVEAGDGSPILDLVVGKQRFRLTGMEDAGTYVRRAGEEQSWLASGGLDLGTEPRDWLDRAVVNIDPELIASLEIDPPEAEPFRVARPERGEDLDLADLAPGETGSSDLARIETTFADLMLADVRRGDELEWPEDTGTITVRTFEGLELDVRVAEIGGEPWLEIREIAVGEPPAPEPSDDAAGEDTATADGAEADAEPGTETEEVAIETEAAPEGDAESGGPEVEPVSTPGGVEAFADDLRARTDGWAYTIPSWLHDRLTRPRDGWLQDDEDGTS